MIFGFELTDTATQQIKNFNDNLLNPEKVISNRLFNGEITQVKDNFYICKLNYLFPLPFVILVIMFITGLIFNIKVLMLISGLFMLLVLFFQSKYFYYIMLVWGLKKSGYKGKIKLLSYQDTIEKLYER